jgi:hypothetical protein
MPAQRTSDSPTTTVRVDRALLDDVAKIAKKNHRTLVGEVAFALERYVEENAHLIGGERVTS